MHIKLKPKGKRITGVVNQEVVVFTRFFADMLYEYNEWESFENNDELFMAKGGTLY